MIKDYDYSVQELESTLGSCPENARCIEKTKVKLHLCIDPTNSPNEDTLDEMAALLRLRKRGCPSAPWLIEIQTDKVSPGMHKEGMIGGYLVYTLMTRLPGSRIDGWWFHRTLTHAKKEEIRQAFKKAFMQVETHPFHALASANIL